VKALAGTVDGVVAIDLDTEEVLDFDPDARLTPASAEVALPRLVAAAAAGSTVVAVVDTRPPLAVSHDAGVTWTQAGGGLPKGRAVAVAEDDPDLVLYGARNRLYLSRDGGRFWTALAPELPEIEAVELRRI
jgi:photosystem II stability/assembly factor-like uncharacterized protein